MKKNLILCLCLLNLLFFSCHKDTLLLDKKPVDNVARRVIFSVTERAINNGGRLANGCAELKDSRFIIISVVTDSANSRVVFDNEKVELFKVNTDFVSKALPLNLGNYKITEFSVIDSDNNIIFVTPKQTSTYAKNVSNPLPVSLVISTNSDTLNTKIEVVPTCNAQISDFGYASFNINIRNRQDSAWINGKRYATITIGNQTWMAQNLNDSNHYSFYNSVCYSRDNRYCDTFGRLYDWNAAKNIDTLIAGWHLPTDAEWDTLQNYLGGASIAGGLMKKEGKSGFDILFGGQQDAWSNYSTINTQAYLWSSTPATSGNAWRRNIAALNSSPAFVRASAGVGSKFSVRLVKDTY